MSSFSSIVALKALDGLTSRSVVTAENIANAGTANYRPRRVSFEQALANAAGLGAQAVAAVEPSIEASNDLQVRLDLEMSTASSTQLRYSALIEVLNRQAQLRALSIKGSL